MSFVEHSRSDVVYTDAKLLDLWQEEQDVVHCMRTEAGHMCNLDVFQVLERAYGISQQVRNCVTFCQWAMLDNDAAQGLREADHAVEEVCIYAAT